jgi:heterotetrameric sarcosine oxidase gamma subunit
MTATLGSPIRRSALEAAHAAEGARWISVTARWPIDYGDRAAEAEAAARAAGLAEIGPVDKLVVHGLGAPALVRVAALGTGIWPIAPDEVLLLFRPGDGAAERVGQELGRGDGSVVDVGSAWTVLRLAGPAAPALMAELSPIDLDPRTFADGAIALGPLVNIRAIVRRHDAAFGPGYTILIARDEAAYAWHAIRELGAPHGLRVVGPAAVEGTHW